MSHGIWGCRIPKYKIEVCTRDFSKKIAVFILSIFYHNNVELQSQLYTLNTKITHQEKYLKKI